MYIFEVSSAMTVSFTAAVQLGYNSSSLILQLHLLVVIEAFSTQTVHLLRSSLWVLYPEETLLLIPRSQGCSQVGVLLTSLNIDSLSSAFILF